MLVSLSTGVIADNTVNCDNAWAVGIGSQVDMIGKTFAEVKLQRKSRVKSLVSMSNTVKVRGKEAVVQPQQMLNHILSVLDSATDLATYLKCELAPWPPSLFDAISLRRPSKAALASFLLSLLSPGSANLPQNPVYVIDGGHLLHSVVRPCPAMYAEICQTYVSHILTHYGVAATVVFDGYADLSSTKSEKQKKRAAKRKSADINVVGHIRATVCQADFFGNSHNKQGLLDILGEDLQATGIAVKQAVGDADILIVSTALQLRASQIGADTDLLVMLVARAPCDCSIFQVNPGHSKAPQKVFDVPVIQEAFGHLKNNLLFLHSVTGSDTTSASYQQGKRKGYKVLKSNDHLVQIVTVFNIPEADAEDIAGEEFCWLCMALLLFTVWMISDLLHSRKRMHKSQQTGFSKWQVYHRQVQLHVSILLGRTVKCNSG